MSNNWLSKSNMNKKEQFIIKLENLIQNIKENGYLIALLNLNKFNNEIKEYLKAENLNIKPTNIKNIMKNDIEIEKQFYVLLEINIKNISESLLKKNSIIFKLELYKPKFYLLELEELIVWIYNVNIKEEKLKKDNKKQFYYLIYNFQKAENTKKQEIFLELLYKIQLYIKNAK